MATNYINLRGTIKWAKVYEPDSYAGAENWKVSFYPADGSEWEKYHKTGLQLKVKEDIDGKYIVFRRPTKKLIKEDLVIFSPPEIGGKVNVSYQDSEGNKIRYYNKGDKISVNRVGDPVNIGNGSLVIVNLSYYQTAKGPGHRLENITVLDLVEFDSSGVHGTPTVKTKTEDESPKEEKVIDLKKDLDDEIPF